MAKLGEKIVIDDHEFYINPEKDYYRGIPTILNNE